MVKHRRKSKKITLFFQIILAIFLLFVFVFLFDLMSRKTLVLGIIITGIILFIGLLFHLLKKDTLKKSILKKLGV